MKYEIELSNNNYKKHIHKIKKYIKLCDSNNYIFKVKYSNDLKNEYKSNFKLLERVINIKDLEKRYSFIYDYVCDYLDKEYIEKNICDFKDDVCIYFRSLKEYDHKNGCCYSDKRGGLCENLNKDHCNISSISCKLYSCPILREKKINYKINNILLLKYFFTIKQKFIIKYSFFKPKSYVMYKLTECNNDKK